MNFDIDKLKFHLSEKDLDGKSDKVIPVENKSGYDIKKSTFTTHSH